MSATGGAGAPGRRRWAGAAIASAMLVGLACAGSGTEPHPTLRLLWRDYQKMPHERAMAVAGDPERARWVAGASGGNATPALAEERALEECQARRERQRVQAACQLYASGDEIVWPGR